MRGSDPTPLLKLSLIVQPTVIGPWPRASSLIHEHRADSYMPGIQGVQHC